jgi:hypothetical protein
VFAEVRDQENCRHPQKAMVSACVSIQFTVVDSKLTGGEKGSGSEDVSRTADPDLSWSSVADRFSEAKRGLFGPSLTTSAYVKRRGIAIELV